MSYAADVVRASRAAQGLSARITDPVLLRSLAVHFSAPALTVDALSPPRPGASTVAGGAENLQLGPQPDGLSSTSTYETEGRVVSATPGVDEPRNGSIGEHRMSSLARNVAREIAETVREHLGVEVDVPSRTPRKVYSGEEFGQPVWVTGPEGVSILAHQGGRSLDGFAWGYGGAGASDLALSILVDAVGSELAAEHFLAFKEDVVATLEVGQPWALSEAQVLAWVAFHATGLDERCIECGGDLIDFDPPNPHWYVPATDERCGQCEGERLGQEAKR